MPSSVRCRRQQLEDLLVVVQVGDGRIAPRIALALFFPDAQLTADMVMQIFGGGLRRLDRQPMSEIALGVIALAWSVSKRSVASWPTVTT